MNDASVSPPRSDNALGAAEAVRFAIARHRALTTLRLLAGPLNGGGNDRLLTTVLGAVGMRSSSREVVATIRTLERIGALDVEARGSLLVVALRLFGAELAEGTERHEDVEPPRPGQTP